jgi:Response regulator containing a CheY-like receiver domain and an HTH DNA-binding domain
MVVDDHAIVRQGIADVLSSEEDIEIVASAKSGEEAVSLAAELHPDVALMDSPCPGWMALRQPGGPPTPRPESGS